MSEYLLSRAYMQTTIPVQAWTGS